MDPDHEQHPVADDRGVPLYYGRERSEHSIKDTDRTSIHTIWTDMPLGIRGDSPGPDSMDDPKCPVARRTDAPPRPFMTSGIYSAALAVLAAVGAVWLEG